MACKFIAKTGKESILFNKLNRTFGQKKFSGFKVGDEFQRQETEADKIYSSIFSDRFKKWYGVDFTKTDVSYYFEYNGQQVGIQDENGEPRLFGSKKTGGFFFVNNKGYKRYITGTNSAMTVDEQEKVFNSLLGFFTEQISDFTKEGNLLAFLSESSKLQDLFSDNKLNKIIISFASNQISRLQNRYAGQIPVETVRILHYLVSKEGASFFADEIRKFYANIGVRILDGKGNPINEGAEDTERTEDGDEKIERTDNSLNITDSVDVSPLRTASKAVKAFLHFIPEFDTEGRPKYDDLFGNIKYVDYEKVHNTLLNIFSDINQGDLSFDEFLNEILDRLSDFHEDLPWTINIKESLEEMRDKGDTNSIIQFIQGVAFTHYDYVVTSFNNNEVKTFLASSTENNISRLIGRWNPSIVENFNKGDVDRITSYKDIEQLRKEANEEKNKTGVTEEQKTKIDNALISDIETYFYDVFESMGIKISKRALRKLFQDKEYNQGAEGVEAAYNVYTFLTKFIDSRANAKREELFDDKSGRLRNFARESQFIRRLAEYQILQEGSFIQESVMRPSGQSFTFSKSSYIKDRLARLTDINSDEIEALKKSSPYYRTSAWIDYLQDNIEKARAVDAHLVSHFKKERSGDRGSDNKSIKLADELTANMDGIHRAIASTDESKFGKQKPIFSTIAAGDKDKAYKLEGFEVIETNWENKTMGANVLERAFAYFEDEFLRAAEVQERMKDDSIEKTLYYDDISEKQKEQNDLNRGKIPGYKLNKPNGFKIFSFPELSYETYLDAVNEAEENRTELQKEIVALDKRIKEVNDGYGLYDLNGEVMFKNGFSRSDSDHKKAVAAIKTFLDTVLSNRTVKAIENVRDIYTNPFNKNGNPKVNNETKKYYQANRKPETGNVEDVMIADYFINQTFANIEYTKVFTGDPAYYKNEDDFNKRLSGSYIDGDKGIFEKGNETFDILVMDSVIEETKEETMEAYKEALIKEFGEEEGLKKIKSYEEVNVADAQAWISLERFIDIQKSLGRVDKVLDKIYEKILKDPDAELTPDEVSHILEKYPPQAMKGVYFNVDKSGKPTYLKYSQAILIPQLVKGSPILEKMRDIMTNEGISEIVTQDGIKAGIPSNRLDKNLNGTPQRVRLNKNAWKLQQDLPTKGVKEQAVGSQIMKTILHNIDQSEEKVYGGQTGSEITREIFDVMDELSNEGTQKFLSEVTDENGNINRARVNKIILRNLKDPDDNLKLALLRGESYDTLPQFRVPIQNALMSYLNKSIKPLTVGGGFIQVSPYGLDRFEGRSEVVWLKDTPGLSGPTPQNGYRGEMLISGSLLNKMLRKMPKSFFEERGLKPDYKDFVTQNEDGSWDTSLLFGPDGIFNSLEDLNAIGYRIPNQGLSSNDSLSIAGILPEIAGDIVVPYPEITSKTGSDYDIDKMYIMFKDFVSDQNNPGKLIENDSHSNKLITLYDKVIASEKTYAQIIDPLDANDLKDDINSLEKKDENPYLFDAIENLILKHSLKGGKKNVGITANHLVHIAYTQFANSSIKGDLGFGYYDSNKDETSLAQFKVQGTNEYITKEVSSFLNGFVDIVKDDYILRGNYNTKTANIAFMLLRSGADKKLITRYFRQPAIMELVAEMERQDAKVVDQFIPDKERPAAVVYEKLKKRDMDRRLRAGEDSQSIKNSHKELDTFFKSQNSKEKVVEQIRRLKLNSIEKLEKNIKNESLLEQTLYLKLFEFHKDKANQLGTVVNSMRADVKGGGRDFSELLSIKNTIRKALHSADITNIQDIFTQTQVGTFYENGIVQGEELLAKLFAAPKFESTINEIAYVLGKTEDAETIRNIEKSLYTYYYYNGPFKELSVEQQKGLFVGARSIGKQLLELQKTSDNFLIKQLIVESVKDNNDVVYDFIKMPNSNKTGNQFRKYIYQAWMELFQSDSKEIRLFAENLVKQSYFQTGFQKTFGSIFEYVPNDYFFISGYYASLQEQFNEIDPTVPDLKAMEFVFRSNAFDPTFVKRISTIPEEMADGSNAKTVSIKKEQEKKKFKQISYGDQFISMSKAFYTTIDNVKKGGKIAPFVTRRVGSRYYFYKYAGVTRGQVVYVATTAFSKRVQRNEIFVFDNVYSSEDDVIGKFVNDWEQENENNQVKAIKSFLGDGFESIEDANSVADRSIDFDLNNTTLSYTPGFESTVDENTYFNVDALRVFKMAYQTLLDAAIFSENGINLLRTKVTEKVKNSRVPVDIDNFGNPFSGRATDQSNTIFVGYNETFEDEDGNTVTLTYEEYKKLDKEKYKELIEDNLIAENQAYFDWLSKGVYPESVNETEKQILDGKRRWILNQISDPKSNFNITLKKVPRLLDIADDFDIPKQADKIKQIVKMYHSDPEFKEYVDKEGAIETETLSIKKDDTGIKVMDKEDAPEFNNLPSKSSSPTFTYAGIGSRQTPPNVLEAMTKAAQMLESKGFTLNTGVGVKGKKEGADKAFSDGTNVKNLFSPEEQGSREREQKIAVEIHPAPSKLTPVGLQLMARNTNQVFGDDLNTPVDFVLFYAKEGNNIRPEGGTGQAVEMARRKGIPTINMAESNWEAQLQSVLDQLSTQPQAAEVQDFSKYKDKDWNTTKAIGRQMKMLEHLEAYDKNNNKNTQERLMFDILGYLEGYSDKDIKSHPLIKEIEEAVKKLRKDGYSFKFIKNQNLFYIETPSGEFYSNRPSSLEENKVQDNDDSVVLQGDLILPIGISGSGKSTWIKTLPKDINIVSPDDIRRELTGDVSDQSKNREVFQEVDRRLNQLLSEGKKVVLDATNLNTKLRKQLMNRINKEFPGKTITYKVLSVDADVAKQRVKKDISAGVDRSAVPEAIIDRQKEMFDETMKSLDSENFSNNAFKETLEGTTQPQSGVEAQKVDIERRKDESVSDYVDRLINKGILQDIEGKYFFEAQARLGIVVNINGVKVPFYQSTSGTDGKVRGHWYPFFGNLGSWLIKGGIEGESGMLNGYGIQSIKDMQSFLNNNIKEFDALYINLVPTQVKRDMYTWNTQPENLFKGDKRLSLNKQETARRLASILGYTVEEARKTKSDHELFKLASKQVLSELAAAPKEVSEYKVGDAYLGRIKNIGGFIDDSSIPEGVKIVDEILPNGRLKLRRGTKPDKKREALRSRALMLNMDYNQSLKYNNPTRTAELKEQEAEAQAELNDYDRKAAAEFRQRTSKAETKPEPLYSAVFVDVDTVTSKYEQVHENLYSHHSTIKYRPESIENLPVGQKMPIKVVGRLTTDRVDVLVVENPLSTNQFPHITLSTAKGVKPAESNKAIAENQDKIVPLSDTLDGVVGFVDTNRKDITSPSDAQSLPEVEPNEQNDMEDLNNCFPE